MSLTVIGYAIKWNRSALESWAHNRANLGSNAGHGGLPIRVRVPHLILAQKYSKAHYEVHAKPQSAQKQVPNPAESPLW